MIRTPARLGQTGQRRALARRIGLARAESLRLIKQLQRGTRLRPDARR